MTSNLLHVSLTSGWWVGHLLADKFSMVSNQKSAILHHSSCGLTRRAASWFISSTRLKGL